MLLNLYESGILFFLMIVIDGLTVGGKMVMAYLQQVPMDW